MLKSVTSASPARLPLLVYLLAAGTFLMGTSEFVVAGLLPDMALDFDISVARAGLTVMVFAVGMIVGAPSMALLTRRLSRRLTLTLALAVFAVGHAVAAATATSSYAVLLGARCLTAFATGAFWAVAAVVATRAVGPAASARALGVVLGGGMVATVLGVPLGAVSGQLVGWRGPFWGLAALASLTAVAVARTLPPAPAQPPAPSARVELSGLRSRRLWLVLVLCATVNAAVLSIYSFIGPLLVERAGLPSGSIPATLVLFGAAAMTGTVLGGRLGDTHPRSTLYTTAATTVIAGAGLCASTHPVPTILSFTLLGLVGSSANPVLVHLALRYGDAAPTLASAMAISCFNVGTAAGTGITGLVLLTRVGTLAPALVGTVLALVVFLPLTALNTLERRTTPLTHR